MKGAGVGVEAGQIQTLGYQSGVYFPAKGNGGARAQLERKMLGPPVPVLVLLMGDQVR